MKMCSACRLRAKYDREPHSMLGRLWKWHTRWCPGWKAYIKSLAPGEQERVIDRYR